MESLPVKKPSNSRFRVFLPFTISLEETLPSLRFLRFCQILDFGRRQFYPFQKFIKFARKIICNEQDFLATWGKGMGRLEKCVKEVRRNEDQEKILEILKRVRNLRSWKVDLSHLTQISIEVLEIGNFESLFKITRF